MTADELRPEFFFPAEDATEASFAAAAGGSHAAKIMFDSPENGNL